ncbi:MFS family permease [Streptacidiphilus sp. MAP12-16]|uniref:MFS transporter n=1 Tax=Streptacidiphilus sp. MAP12-16 TaxID=3156300 RepID=UPI0035183101
MAELSPAATRLSESLLSHELAPREVLRAPTLSRWNAVRGVRVALSAAILLLLLAGANLATPLYPVLQQRLHLTALDTTLLFTTYVFALVPVLAAAGHWSDQLGRRALVLPAVALAAGGDAIFATAGSLGQLAAGRAVQGIAVGLATGAAGAALGDLLPDRPSLAAKLTLAASAGGVALGPLLGAALSGAVPGGDPVLAPFLLHACALLALCIPLAVLHPRSPGHHHSEARPQRSPGALRPRALSLPARGRRPFLLAAASGFVSYAVFGVYLSLAPSYTASLLHTRDPLVGALVAALLLGSSATAQLLARPTHGRAVPALGMAGLALGLTLVVLAGYAHTPALLFLGSVLAGTSQGLAFRALFTRATAALDPSGRAGQLSTLWVIVYLGSSLPIIGVGLLAQHLGILPAVTLFTTVAATACVALAGASLQRTS